MLGVYLHVTVKPGGGEDGCKLTLSRFQVLGVPKSIFKGPKGQPHREKSIGVTFEISDFKSLGGSEVNFFLQKIWYVVISDKIRDK